MLSGIQFTTASSFLGRAAMHDSRSSEFFGFHPVRIRVGVLIAAAACAVLTASALAGARGHQPLAWLRCAIYFGLLLGFSWLFVHLRPRAGWGVTVGPLGITISRPLKSEAQLAWSQVSVTRRDVGRRTKFGVFSKKGRSSGSSRGCSRTLRDLKR
jgi:hypothetical protein